MELLAELKDNEFEYLGFTHLRKISRGVLLNDKNEVLLIKIFGEDDIEFRDNYETPGGGVKINESLEAAVLREVKEETGYEAVIIKEIGHVIDYYNVLKRKNDSYYFLLRVKDFKGQSLEEYEKNLFKGVEFHSIDEAIELYNSKDQYKIARLVRNREVIVLKRVKEMLEEGTYGN